MQCILSNRLFAIFAKSAKNHIPIPVKKFLSSSSSRFFYILRDEIKIIETLHNPKKQLCEYGKRKLLRRAV